MVRDAVQGTFMSAFFAGGRGCREARVHLRPAANTFPARTKGAGFKGAPTVDEGAGFLSLLSLLLKFEEQELK